MEDDLKKKMKDDLKEMKMEDELIFVVVEKIE
jgi:hypothetical protein